MSIRALVSVPTVMRGMTVSCLMLGSLVVPCPVSRVSSGDGAAVATGCSAPTISGREAGPRLGRPPVGPGPDGPNPGSAHSVWHLPGRSGPSGGRISDVVDGIHLRRVPFATGEILYIDARRVVGSQT